MKYAIQLSMFYIHSDTEEEYEQWEYVGVKGEHRIFVMNKEINENTKLFNTAKEAGEYVDKHFGADEMRCSYSSARIVEVNV